MAKSFNVVSAHVSQRLSLFMALMAFNYSLSLYAYNEAYDKVSDPNSFGLVDVEAKNAAAYPVQELVFGGVFVGALFLEAIAPYMLALACCIKRSGCSNNKKEQDQEAGESVVMLRQGQVQTESASTSPSAQTNSYSGRFASGCATTLKAASIYVPKTLIFLAFSSGMLGMSAAQVWAHFALRFDPAAPSNASHTLKVLSQALPPMIMPAQAILYLVAHHVLFSSHRQLQQPDSVTSSNCCRGSRMEAHKIDKGFFLNNLFRPDKANITSEPNTPKYNASGVMLSYQSM